jgi:predicted DNA-binding transcriptional regulator YafY
MRMIQFFSQVLPKAIAEHSRIVQEAVELEPSPWLVKTDAKWLMVLASAVQARVPISFAYKSFNGFESQREVEPYSVLHHDGRWHMIGHCRLRLALRSFRVDRMLEPRVFNGNFKRPTNFGARAFLRESLPFAPSPWTVEVWLDLLPEEVHWRVLPHKMILEAEDDGTVLRCGTGDLEWVAAVLLGLKLKCRVMIREPVELRAAFVALAERAVEISRQS